MSQLTNNQILDNDINRFKTNSKASNYAIFSLVFEFLFFLTVYGQKSSGIEVKFSESVLGSEYVYTYMMGLSVLLNLVILLGVFLASQELKNYNKKYCYFVWAVAVVQIVRIFLYPLQVYNTTLYNGNALVHTYSFVFMIVWLVLSAALLIISGIYGYIGATKREKFAKLIEGGEVDLEAAYVAEDEVEEVPQNA